MVSDYLQKINPWQRITPRKTPLRIIISTQYKFKSHPNPWKDTLNKPYYTRTTTPLRAISLRDTNTKKYKTKTIKKMHIGHSLPISISNNKETINRYM